MVVSLPVRNALLLILPLVIAAPAGGASAAPPSCQTRFDCTHGFACSGGQCVPPECASDSQCGEGRYCDAAGACQQGAPAPAPQIPPSPEPRLPAGAAEAAQAASPPSELPRSRFYWHEALGLGVLAGQSSFTDGTRGFTTFTSHVVTTAGVRLSRPLALGGTLHFYFAPPTTVVEERSLGHKELAAPFGVAGLIAPSVILIRGQLRFDLSPGLFWFVLGHAEGHSGGPSLGGVGFGGSVAAAYDLLFAERFALGLEGRLLVAGYGNGDVTHTWGWAAAGTLLVSLRAR